MFVYSWKNPSASSLHSSPRSASAPRRQQLTPLTANRNVGSYPQTDILVDENSNAFHFNDENMFNEFDLLSIKETLRGFNNDKSKFKALYEE